MKKLFIIMLCALLCVSCACAEAPKSGNAESSAGGEGSVYNGANAPEASEPISGAPTEDDGALTFKAQYIRTDGYHEDVHYPVVTVITSRAQLESYYSANEGKYDLHHREKVYSDTSIGFEDAMERYDEDWFSAHQLILVLVEEGSGSIRHEVKYVKGGETPEIGIERILPEIGTADMAEWHIMIELASGTVEDGANIAVNFS